MRDYIDKSFRRSNRELRSVHKMSLRELDQHLTTFDSIKRDAKKLSVKHLDGEMFLAKLPVATLCYLALAANRPKDEPKIIARDFPANDFQLACLLTRVINTSICIIQLIRDGFNTQARILVRSLDESLYQTLILLSDPGDYAAYHKVEDAGDTKRVWYELFGGKKRLFRKLAALERRLGMSEAAAAEFMSWREERMEYFGEVIHNGVISTSWGSLAHDFEEDQMHLAILGHACPSGRMTLEHLITQLFHFCRTLHELLLKIHHWVPNQREKYVVKYLIMHRMLLDLNAEGSALKTE